MISGAHVVIYSRDAEADRAFIADVLGFPHVDAGHGWLIFQLPPAEVAVHPGDGADGHELYLLCDDIQATLAGLAARGAVVSPEVTEQRWGIVATITLPSGSPLSLYQPRHPLAREGPPGGLGPARRDPQAAPPGPARRGHSGVRIIRTSSRLSSGASRSLPGQRPVTCQPSRR